MNLGQVPREYLVAHLEEALARDPRLAEQGLRVQVVGDPPTVVLTGVLSAAAQRAMAVEVVRQLLPGALVRDETSVADYPEGDEPEEVR